MADSTVNTGASGAPIRVLTALGSGSGDQQVVTLADSAGNLLAPAKVSTAGAVTSTAAATASVAVLVANTARLGALVYNDAGGTLYLALAAAASLTAYTTQVPPGGLFELPVPYTGIITGVWSAAGGFARATELT